MKTIEVDPWIRCKTSALETYRVDGTLYTIPFVVAKNLTMTKSKEKYMLECRRLPKKYMAMFEEKTAIQLPKPIEMAFKPTCYMNESSSQHMATILDGVDLANFRFEKADVLVTNETLNTIAGAVFQQEKSWRLRAFVENVQGKTMIVLCADDLFEESTLFEAENFDKERSESLSFAQELCESDKKSNVNPHLHGSLAVLSTIRNDYSSVQMVVVGEVDMVAGQQAVNTVVRNGIGRSNRIIFGPDEEKICDYIWSRSFWLGLTDCVIGSRQSDEENIEVAQRYSLTDFYRQHRHRNRKLADVATNCVARVLIRLREAVQSDPRANWIIEYEGREQEKEELDNVRISKANESYSFWLIREKFYMQKIEMMQKYNPKMRVERTRKYDQKSKIGNPRNHCAIP